MKRFEKESLTPADVRKLQELSRLCKRDILTMTTLAESGHPGGSMSSLDIYLTVYSFAKISPGLVEDPGRDRIVISHGHTSPGVYSVLGRLGFFDIDMAVATFRLAGSIFDGHVVRKVPGVEWSTGNLGQGLSAGCGFSLASKLRKRDSHTFVLMSDGEQTKGQVAEARRFAIKYGLNRLTVVVDYNKIQISGQTEKVMPCNVITNYMADCWDIAEVDGHDFVQIYQALRKSLSSEKPVCIIAHTVLGKGVSFMENKHQYHGKPLNEEEYKKAVAELGLEPVLEKYLELREKDWQYPEKKFFFSPRLQSGKPILYPKEEKTDNRTGFGKALLEIARANQNKTEYPVVVFDCDLASSVKTDLFEKEFPDRFFQCGVQEHHAATVAGVLSVENFITFFADFGVFGVDETYNQARLNDQNYANLKVICTHVGFDVGEDGKTHQCIDYIGTFRNLFHFKLIVPADPNQTDRAVRYVAEKAGNWFVGMGRSKTPNILKENGEVYFDSDYQFEYGKADLLRSGKDGCIITMGTMVPRALEIHESLKKEGLEIGVLNFSCPLVVDEEKMEKALQTGLIVTYEDHHADTGLGATVALYLADKGYAGKFFRLGIKDYGSSGKPDSLFKTQGLDPASVSQFIKNILSSGEKK